MQQKIPHIIVRHRRENLKKCSLRGLESRPDLQFYTYPKSQIPACPHPPILLTINAPILTPQDQGRPWILLDGTWKLVEKMRAQLPQLTENAIPRSIPPHYQTAYPRRQPDCQDPSRGLASVEALFIAYYLTGIYDLTLLKDYPFAKKFLQINPSLQSKE